MSAYLIQAINHWVGRRDGAKRPTVGPPVLAKLALKVGIRNVKSFGEIFELLGGEFGLNIDVSHSDGLPNDNETRLSVERRSYPDFISADCFSNLVKCKSYLIL